MRVTGTTQLDASQAERLLAVARSLVSDLDLESILGQIIKTARELTGAGYAVLDTAAPGETTPLQGRGTLRVPIAIRDEPYGNVYLAEKAGGREFTEGDRIALAILADWAGVAIGNARIYATEHERREELERAIGGLEATTAIARALGGETDLDAVLNLIVKRGRVMVDASWTAIMIRDGEELELRATAGDRPMRPLGQRYSINDTLAGRTLRTGAPRTVSDLSRHAAEGDREMVKALGAEHALLVPLEFRGRGLGVLMVATDEDRGFSPEQEQLMQGFAASAATAVATAQSVAADQLRQSVASAERERRRWARDLHDETLQELGAIKVALDSALRRGRPETLESTLTHVQQTIAGSIDGLHRMITELRPAALDELGVEAAIEALVDRRRSRRLAIDVAVDLDWEAGRQSVRLAPEVESSIYRIVQEALTNVGKHAQANNVAVEIVERDRQVLIEIRDDGIGLGSSDTRGSGLGLIGMRERVALLGGQLDIEAPQAGGTTIHATLPALHL